VLETEHYAIVTTVADNEVLERFARVMEASHAQYRAMLPASVPLSDRRMKVMLFATRQEWARYTIELTGRESELYLGIVQGGYTYRDEFVCWLSNEGDALATAAHEGLHQFIARHFRTRLPPTLEEGLACTFETIRIERDGVVRFDVAKNVRRQAALRDALAGGYAIPLDTLLLVHAGDFRDKNPALSEAYYAQAWALGAMLRTNPRYRLPLASLLSAAATGNTPIDVGRNDGSGMYDPNQIRPMLQRYLAPEWEQFKADFDAAQRKLAAREDAATSF
jgi:hypothetical protein